VYPLLLVERFDVELQLNPASAPSARLPDRRRYVVVYSLRPVTAGANEDVRAVNEAKAKT
jgi:hypothetical protein